MRNEPYDVRITVLGTGTSTGIPVINCGCHVCGSKDPRDRRFRCSCLVEAEGVSILIDAGPDFRAQALRFGIPEIDAVLLTHHHYDHVAGLDDLRPYLFHNRRVIPCFGPETSVYILRHMFGYMFDRSGYPGVPTMDIQGVSSTFDVQSRRHGEGGVTVTPIPVLHGTLQVFGYRIGNFAWLTDTSHIPESSLSLLENLDVLFLDALRRRPHPMHFSFDEAVETARAIGARQTFFIHMTHSILHGKEDVRLPERISLAYDGMHVGASR